MRVGKKLHSTKGEESSQKREKKGVMEGDQRKKPERGSGPKREELGKQTR